MLTSWAFTRYLLLWYSMNDGSVNFSRKLIKKLLNSTKLHLLFFPFVNIWFSSFYWVFTALSILSFFVWICVKRYCLDIWFFFTMKFRTCRDLVYTFGKVFLESFSYIFEVNIQRHLDLVWNAWKIKLLSKSKVHTGENRNNCTWTTIKKINK